LSQFDQRRAARERDATSSSWWIPLLNVTLFGVAQVLARCHDWMHADQPPSQGLPSLLHRTFRRPFAFPCRLHHENYRSLDAVGLGLISIIIGGRSLYCLLPTALDVSIVLRDTLESWLGTPPRDNLRYGREKECLGEGKEGNRKERGRDEKGGGEGRKR